MTKPPPAGPAVRKSPPREKRLFDIDIIDGLGPSMFVGLMTPQGIVLEANRPALEATGLKPEDVIGKPFEETYWWSYSPVVQQELRDAITRAAAGEASRYDVRLRGAGNHFVDIDFSLQPLRDDAGRVVFLVPSGSDITGRTRKDAALRESNENFRQLTDNITDAFWIRSPDMQELHYVSPAFERIWGRSVESFYANPQEWTDFIVPEDRARVLAAFAGLTGTVRSMGVEYRIVRPDGEIRWVRSRGFQVHDAAGMLIRITGIVTDTTDRKQVEAALQESEVRYRALVEWSPEATTVSRNGKLLFLNPAAVKMLGAASQEELLDVPLLDMVHPVSRDISRRRLMPNAALGGTLPMIEQQLVKRDGTIIDVEIEGRAILYDGELATFSSMRDVTDRKRAQEALQTSMSDVVKSEERYRRIVETANEGISILNTQSNLTFVNRRFAEMFGYTVDEMIGKSLFDLVPGAARALTEQRVERSQQGISEEIEVAYLRKDGSELWALLKTSPIRDADDQWAGTLGMTTDRTRYRSTEADLRKSEQQYRQIVETTTDGVIKVDSDAKVVFVNARFAEMLGYEPAEMVGESLYAFMDAEAKVIATQSLENRRRGVRNTVDINYRHKDGTNIAVNVAGSPLLDADGRNVGSLGVVRDVSEQRKLQSQLMVSDRMASVGTLAAGVAHEINNPLAAVIANLDYIVESLARTGGGDPTAPSPTRSDAWLQEEIKGPLEDAREAAQRVRFIVRDLKIFSRSPTEEPRGAVDVRAIMESALRMAWNEIRHRAHLVKNYDPVPGVTANEGRLGQVFLNLLVNAAQSMPEGRAEHNEIGVATKLDGDRVIIEVSDTGAGIPPEIVGRIFDAFFTTKAVGVGTGLGLAICQRIVTDMGGELTVESQVGKGTTFRVALPVSRDEASTPAAPVEQAVPAGRRGRILLVDDEELVLRSVKRTLATQHDVVAIGSAKEALALCAAGETFDIILCDLMMPDMTGMDLYRELALIAPEQADRMIFITGGAFTDTAREFLAATSKEHIEKPFHAANLRAIVQRYLR